MSKKRTAKSNKAKENGTFSEFSKKWLPSVIIYLSILFIIFKLIVLSQEHENIKLLYEIPKYNDLVSLMNEQVIRYQSKQSEGNLEIKKLNDDIKNKLSAFFSLYREFEKQRANGKVSPEIYQKIKADATELLELFETLKEKEENLKTQNSDSNEKIVELLNEISGKNVKIHSLEATKNEIINNSSIGAEIFIKGTGGFNKDNLDESNYNQISYFQLKYSVKCVTKEQSIKIYLLDQQKDTIWINGSKGLSRKGGNVETFSLAYVQRVFKSNTSTLRIPINNYKLRKGWYYFLIKSEDDVILAQQSIQLGKSF